MAEPDHRSEQNPWAALAAELGLEQPASPPPPEPQPAAAPPPPPEPAAAVPEVVAPEEATAEGKAPGEEVPEAPARRGRGRGRRGGREPSPVAEDTASADLGTPEVEPGPAAEPTLGAELAGEEAEGDEPAIEAGGAGEAPAAEGEAPRTGKRRRRRRRRKGGKTEEAAGNGAEAGEEAAPAANGIANEIDAAELSDEADESSAERDIPEIVAEDEPSAIAEDEDDEEGPVVDLSSWMVPTWDELIATLHRPER